MAQDSNLRHLRSDPPHAREPAPAGGGNDPLAELARLIGQNDPFADVSGKDARSRPAAARPSAASSQDAPEWLARPSAAGGQPGTDPGYDEQAAQPGYEDPNDQYQNDPRYAEAGYDQAGYQGAYAGEGQNEDPAYGYQTEAYYDDQQQGYDDGYDAPPAGRRRGGLMTVAAVVALAVVGTAGALGYRAWSGPSGPSGEPPVIKAEQSPTKVVPATPSSDAPLSKQYDRGTDRGGERMVPREEQPIDPRSAAARPPVPSAAQSGVLPPLGGAAGAPALGPGDPKPVKTVTIRPDQAGAAAAQPQAARPPVAAAPPPAPVRVPTIPIQSAPPRAQPAPESGGYVVQVASQRSEADAQSSFRMLQQKYPSVLGSHRVSIRRADLGERGIYYRAQVGPFASAEEANEMCGSLKTAGGQCIVQRN